MRGEYGLSAEDGEDEEQNEKKKSTRNLIQVTGSNSVPAECVQACTQRRGPTVGEGDVDALLKAAAQGLVNLPGEVGCSKHHHNLLACGHSPETTKKQKKKRRGKGKGRKKTRRGEGKLARVKARAQPTNTEKQQLLQQ